MTVSAYLIGVAAVLLLIPISVLAAEVLPAADVEKRDIPGANRPSVAIVMPAHNEAYGIRDTIGALLPQLLDTDRLVVVADNCSDETAAIAADAGAEVIVRQDSQRRGKGYALDYGMQHLTRNPPQVVMIVDADCRVAAGSIGRLVLACARANAPVQACYLLRAPAGSGVMVRIAEFACVLKNWVRPLGLRRLGLPCQLMGTGMAFPWAQISGAALATGHIVEDLKLGLELAAAGAAPVFCPQAEVSSSFPSSEEGFKTQRTRWEHGYLAVLTKDAPAVLWKAVLRRDLRLLAMGMDLCVPPISLLTLLTGAVWSASALLYLISRSAAPFAIASVAVGLLFVAVFAAWARFGRNVVSLGHLLMAVAYALRKLPLYARFLVARQIHWVRSKRDHEHSTRT